MDDSCVACGEVAEGKPLYKKLGSTDCQVDVFTALHEMQLLSLPLDAKNTEYICWDCDETISEEYTTFLANEAKKKAMEDKRKQQDEARNIKLQKKLKQAFKKAHNDALIASGEIPSVSKYKIKEKQREENRYHAAFCLLCKCSFEASKARGYQRFTLQKMVDDECDIADILQKMGLKLDLTADQKRKRFVCCQCYNKMRRNYKAKSKIEIDPIWDPPENSQSLNSQQKQEVFKRRPTTEEHAAEIQKLIPASIADLYKVVKEGSSSSSHSKHRSLKRKKGRSDIASGSKAKRHKAATSSSSSDECSSSDSSDLEIAPLKPPKQLHVEKEDPPYKLPSNHKSHHSSSKSFSHHNGHPSKTVETPRSHKKPGFSPRLKSESRPMKPKSNGSIASSKTPTIRTLLPKGVNESGFYDNDLAPPIAIATQNPEIVDFGICNLCGLAYNGRPKQFWFTLSHPMPLVVGVSILNALQILESTLADVSESIREKELVCKPCFSRICKGFRSQILQKIADKRGTDLESLFQSHVRVKVSGAPGGFIEFKGVAKDGSELPRKLNGVYNNNNDAKDMQIKKNRTPKQERKKNLDKHDSEWSHRYHFSLVKALNVPTAAVAHDMELIALINESRHLRYKGKVVMLNNGVVDMVDLRGILPKTTISQCRTVRLERFQNLFQFSNFHRNLKDRPDWQKCILCSADGLHLRRTTHWLDDPVQPPNLMVPLRWAQLSLTADGQLPNLSTEDGKVCHRCHRSLRESFGSFVGARVAVSHGLSSGRIVLDKYKVSFDSVAMNIVADPLEACLSDERESSKVIRKGKNIDVSEERGKDASSDCQNELKEQNHISDLKSIPICSDKADSKIDKPKCDTEIKENLKTEQNEVDENQECKSLVSDSMTNSNITSEVEQKFEDKEAIKPALSSESRPALPLVLSKSQLAPPLDNVSLDLMLSDSDDDVESDTKGKVQSDSTKINKEAGTKSYNGEDALVDDDKANKEAVSVQNDTMLEEKVDCEKKHLESNLNQSQDKPEGSEKIVDVTQENIISLPHEKETCEKSLNESLVDKNVDEMEKKSDENVIEKSANENVACESDKKSNNEEENEEAENKELNDASSQNLDQNPTSKDEQIKLPNVEKLTTNDETLLEKEATENLAESISTEVDSSTTLSIPIAEEKDEKGSVLSKQSDSVGIDTSATDKEYIDDSKNAESMDITPDKVVSETNSNKAAVISVCNETEFDDSKEHSDSNKNASESSSSKTLPKVRSDEDALHLDLGEAVVESKSTEVFSVFPSHKVKDSDVDASTAHSEEEKDVIDSASTDAGCVQAPVVPSSPKSPFSSLPETPLPEAQTSTVSNLLETPAVSSSGDDLNMSRQVEKEKVGSEPKSGTTGVSTDPINPSSQEPEPLNNSDSKKRKKLVESDVSLKFLKTDKRTEVKDGCSETSIIVTKPVSKQKARKSFKSSSIQAVRPSKLSDVSADFSKNKTEASVSEKQTRKSDTHADKRDIKTNSRINATKASTAASVPGSSDTLSPFRMNELFMSPMMETQTEDEEVPELGEDSVAPFAQRKKAKGRMGAVDAKAVSAPVSDAKEIKSSLEKIWQTVQEISLDDLLSTDYELPMEESQFSVGLLLALSDLRQHLGASLEDLLSWLQRLMPISWRQANRKASVDKFSTYLFSLSSEKTLTSSVLSQIISQDLFDEPAARVATEPDARPTMCFLNDVSVKKTDKNKAALSWEEFLEPLNLEDVIEGRPSRVSWTEFNNGFLYALWKMNQTAVSDNSEETLVHWLSLTSTSPMKNRDYLAMAKAASAIDVHLQAYPNQLERLRAPIVVPTDKSSSDRGSKRNVSGKGKTERAEAHSALSTAASAPDSEDVVIESEIIRNKKGKAFRDYPMDYADGKKAVVVKPNTAATSVKEFAYSYSDGRKSFSKDKSILADGKSYLGVSSSSPASRSPAAGEKTDLVSKLSELERQMLEFQRKSSKLLIQKQQLEEELHQRRKSSPITVSPTHNS